MVNRGGNRSPLSLDHSRLFCCVNLPQTALKSRFNLGVDFQAIFAFRLERRKSIRQGLCRIRFCQNNTFADLFHTCIRQLSIQRHCQKLFCIARPKSRIPSLRNRNAPTQPSLALALPRQEDPNNWRDCSHRSRFSFRQ